jgi:hypothetical protein
MERSRAHSALAEVRGEPNEPLPPAISTCGGSNRGALSVNRSTLAMLTNAPTRTDVVFPWRAERVPRPPAPIGDELIRGAREHAFGEDRGAQARLRAPSETA